MKSKFLTVGLSVLMLLGFSCGSAQTDEHKDGDKHDMGKMEMSKVSTNDAKQLQEEIFAVSGKCDMCKGRIEKAAKNVEGVKSADWNLESKMITVTFAAPANVHMIHQAIANVGHDAGEHKATKEAYDALPGCCKYREE